LLLAHVVEGDVELVAHLVAHDPADADPAGLGQAFEPSRDIDAVAKDVALVDDDVAEIYPDADSMRRLADKGALRSAIAVCIRAHCRQRTLLSETALKPTHLPRNTNGTSSAARS
jgi:hypothetical protein